MIFLTLLICVSSEKSWSWEKDSISITRELKGAGLKQDLVTKVNLLKPMSCILKETISQDWFIDIEEMPKSLKIQFFSKIDIELPSSLSSSHNFNIYLDDSIEFAYPIHIRYNDCDLENDYKKISLLAPVVECENNIYKINTIIESQVPIGKLTHLPGIISATGVVVLVTVVWICLTIHNLKKSI
ncbi:hypothetical protein SteCoe_32092 [Stentor coeruleus]|uniref:Phosphatidylinositol-glycan biosynthesis class X protein n=1 Tax=Stentor coeruleus TaxID=5963 RepID=A0A1R2AZT7_9CILI|nr:hypothetical protein SteCoe_32092 [Stentor coeruleus]